MICSCENLPLRIIRLLLGSTDSSSDRVPLRGQGQRAHILQALHGRSNGKPLQLYSQTLVAIDGLLRAWSGAFRASKCPKAAAEIDQAVNNLLSDFIAFYRDNVIERSQTDKRRVLGVHVLADDVIRRVGKT
jgi:hypothetical protein